MLLADPGTPHFATVDEELTTVLRELAFLAWRVGLWSTCAQALAWVGELDDLSSDERSELAEIESHIARRQYAPVTVRRGERVYTGRYFSELAMLLGHRGERLVDREWMAERLAQRALGSFWFSGVDVRFIRALERRDAAALLQLSASMTDFTLLETEFDKALSEELRAAAESEIRSALARW